MAKSTITKLILVAVVFLLFSGCAEKQNTTGTGVPEAANIDYQKWLNHETDQQGQIVLGDILLVYHEEKSDLNNVLWVNPGGIARDPVFSGATVPGSILPRGIDAFVVINMTADQVKGELEKRYKEKGREVTLQVKNMRKCILVAGELVNAGLYESTEAKPLEKVVEEAGGFTDKADTTVVSVFRKEAGAVGIKRLNYKKDAEEAKAYQIIPGDRITVLRKINYSTN